MDEMDIQEALTLALRVRRRQFDANTGNLRSSAQIDPRSASPSDGSFGSDMPIPHVHVHVYTTCRNEAFQRRVVVSVKRSYGYVTGVRHTHRCRAPQAYGVERSFLQLRVAVRVLRVAVRVLGVALILIALRLLHFFRNV